VATLAAITVPVPGPRRPARDPNAIPEKNEHRVKHGPDEPDEALRWMQIGQRNENGVIAPDGLMNARRQMDAMRVRERAAAQAAVGGEIEPIAGISPGAWTWIGPGNIGGRTRAVAIHPVVTSTIFAGSVGGGMWKTTDSGVNWTVVDDFMTSLAISSIVFRPGDPSTMFAGTGEGFFNGDAIRGAGVFKSTDGGTTWIQLASTANSNFYYVNELACSPDGNTLLAATGVGVFQSTNQGTTWSLKLNQGNGVLDVKYLPGSNTRAVAGGRIKDAYYSSDGGAVWTLSSGMTTGGANKRVEFGVSPAQPAWVYASVAEGGAASSPPAEVWKSVDNGVTYALAGTPPASSLLGTQGWYDNAIWVDPTNASVVVVGGQPISRSLDGGATFAALGGVIHSDHHVIVSDPNFDGVANRRVYFGNDGGVYKAESLPPASAPAFTKLNNNFGVTQFYGGDGLTSNGKIFGGTQDNGTLLYTGNAQNWVATIGGDGGFSTADRTNNYLYGEFQWLQVHRSVNGANASLIDGCGKPAPYRLDDGCTSSSSSTNFIAPIVLDPNTPDRLLAGGVSLWRTNDPRTALTGSTGPSWAIIKVSTGSPISWIAVAKGNSDAIWVGHNNGDVYFTSNGTAASPTWTRRDNTSPALPNRAVTSIAVDPSNAGIVYVSFGGFNTGNLWRTIDNGANWTDVSGSGGGQLPAAPIRSVVPHPTAPGWLYVGTDVGVFTSENNGAAWHLPHDGPANVAVFQLFWMNTTLVAVTHGRGMFTVDAGDGTVAPAITANPSNQDVTSGQTTSFTAAASGTPAPTYQWQVSLNGGGSYSDLTNVAPYSGVTSTSLLVTGSSSAQNGLKYRAVATNSAGSATSNAATFTVTTPVITTPAPGSTLPDAAVTFQWTGGPGVSQYVLWVGSSPGANDLVVKDCLAATSCAVTGLPVDGRALYVRLYWLVGTWQFGDATFTAESVSASARAQMLTPAPGSTLTTSTVAFQWTGGTSVTQYVIWLGTTAGANDLVVQDRGTNLGATVMNLPTNGSTIFVRLWSLVGPAWQSNDYTYTASSSGASARAQMLTPAPGSTLSASTVEFQWTGGTGVSAYYLWVGNSLGASDLVNKDCGSNLTCAVTGLPVDGRALFVRLWSLVGPTWLSIDYTYTAATSATARAQMMTPAPGSILTASNVLFQWAGGVGVTQYVLWVGTTAGANDLVVQDRGTNLSATVIGLPIAGRTLYVRLWSLIAGQWQSNDYTYTATSGNPPVTARMTSPAPGSTLAASNVLFQWVGGTGVNQYVLWVGTSAGANDLVVQDRGTNLSATVAGLPANGSTLFVRLWSLVGVAWQFADYTYTAAPASAPARAQTLTPAPGSTLAASTVEFQWTGGTNASQYVLWIGTSLGASDLFNLNRGTNLGAVVMGLPVNGSTLFVRLWSLVGGTWQSNDYTYAATSSGASARAEMLIQAPSSRLTASTVAFQWMGGTGVSHYHLWIGTSAGASDLLNQDQATNLSTTVVGLPTNGSTLYVRLWSLVGPTWQFRDYTYTAK
jgi:hypothetical protein